MDIKILSKILAKRLEKAMSEMVHPSQVGFILKKDMVQIILSKFPRMGEGPGPIILC